MDLERKILSEHVPKEPHPPEFFNKITVPPPAVDMQAEDAATEASSGTRIKRTSCRSKESVRRKARRVIVQSKKSKK